MAWPAVTSLAVCSLLLLEGRVLSQAFSLPSGPAGPQAETRDELDNFGLILEAQTPQANADAAQSFLKKYPDSKFAEYAALAAMHGYYDLGNFQRSSELASVAMRLNPYSVDVLLHSARLLIAPGAQDSRGFAEAQSLTQAGLSRLKAMKLPASADSRAWLRTKNSFLATGQCVLGWLLLREGKSKQAAALLEEAATLDPQGEYFYRLSIVHATGDNSTARSWAQRAIQAGPAWVSALGREQLKTLQENVAK